MRRLNTFDFVAIDGTGPDVIVKPVTDFAKKLVATHWRNKHGEVALTRAQFDRAVHDGYTFTFVPTRHDIWKIFVPSPEEIL